MFQGLHIHTSPLSGYASVLLHSQHPDGDTLLREALLPLLLQDDESAFLNKAPKDAQVSDHAAVQWVQDTAFPGHVVLENDNAIILQAILTPDKKLQEIFIGQVSYR